MSRISTQIIPSVRPSLMSAQQVKSEFFTLLQRGASVRTAGKAKENPEALLLKTYAPRFKVELFSGTYYLSAVRQIPELRFFVGYFLGGKSNRAEARIHARIFYKDLSLAWRVASHLISTEDEFWIGKGAVRMVRSGGYTWMESVESTTDLPFEIQTVFELLNKRSQRVVQDEEALHLVLKSAPTGRMAPYADFAQPRAKAAEDAKNLIFGGRSIARFSRSGDPSSLLIRAGFEPDFDDGVVEQSSARSTLYHGRVRRVRIVSKNRQIQYFFMAGKKQVWMLPPQALTTQLSSYGVRTIDVVADDKFFIPGYEYHYVDPAVDSADHFTQIPKGFAGKSSAYNNDRADASLWLDQMPVIQEFRKKIT